jgi:hypothetical protein
MVSRTLAPGVAQVWRLGDPQMLLPGLVMSQRATGCHTAARQGFWTYRARVWYSLSERAV